MKSPPDKSPYYCRHCGAVGELPLLDGDTACPQCRSHLWTRTSRRSRVTFDPDPNCPILPSRPPARVARQVARKADFPAVSSDGVPLGAAT